jgi:putative transcriptional regulator
MPAEKHQQGESPLKKLRERIGLTQQELATRCGIGLRTYIRWETGESVARPTIPQIKALCRQLKISIEDLPDEFGPARSRSKGE